MNRSPFYYNTDFDVWLDPEGNLVGIEFGSEHRCSVENVAAVTTYLLGVGVLVLDGDTVRLNPSGKR